MIAFLAAVVTFSLPSLNCDSLAILPSGQDTCVVSQTSCHDLATAYLWGQDCCDTHPTLIGALDVRGKEGQKVTMPLAWVDMTQQHVIQLYVTTNDLSGNRSQPSNYITWSTFKWDGYAWVPRP